MAEMLRPMSTGELMDRTFTLYRRNFKLFVGIATVGPAAYIVFQLAMLGSLGVPGMRGTAAPFAGLSFWLGIAGGLLIMLAGMAISHAATVKAVAAVHLGLTTTIVGAYKALKGRILRILGVFFSVSILSMLAAGAIIVLASIVGSLVMVGAARAGTAGAILGGLFALAVAIAGGLLAIAVYIRYSLAIAACVVEDTGVGASMKRSAFLSKGSRGRILAIYSVFVILAFVIGVALGSIATVVGLVTHNLMIRLILNYVASFVAGSLTGPLATIGIALVYYDERVRKEAFDLQWMMASLDSSSSLPSATAAAQS